MGREYVLVANLAKLEAAGNTVHEHVETHDVYGPEGDIVDTETVVKYSLTTVAGEELFVGTVMHDGKVVQFFNEDETIPEVLKAGAERISLY